MEIIGSILKYSPSNQLLNYIRNPYLRKALMLHYPFGYFKDDHIEILNICKTN